MQDEDMLGNIIQFQIKGIVRNVTPKSVRLSTSPDSAPRPRTLRNTRNRGSHTLQHRKLTSSIWEMHRPALFNSACFVQPSTRASSLSCRKYCQPRAKYSADLLNRAGCRIVFSSGPPVVQATSRHSFDTSTHIINHQGLLNPESGGCANQQ